MKLSVGLIETYKEINSVSVLKSNGFESNRIGIPFDSGGGEALDRRSAAGRIDSTRVGRGAVDDRTRPESRAKKIDSTTGLSGRVLVLARLPNFISRPNENSRPPFLFSPIYLSPPPSVPRRNREQRYYDERAARRAARAARHSQQAQGPGPQNDGQGLVRPGRQGGRHEVRGRGGHQDHQVEEAVPDAGEDGDQPPRAAQPERRRRPAQHSQAPGHLLLQEPPVHSLRDAQPQPLRAPQEHAVRRRVAQPDTEVRQADTQGARVPGPGRHRRDTLRPQAGEHTAEAPEAERDQGHRLREQLPVHAEDVLVHTKQVLQESGGHARAAVRRAHRHVEPRLHIGRDAHG
ncbi:hypothetical protein THAOC_29002 [Thalassiosira oceanica]|uniref:Uncharacterized protein n=1 Tax=Thalassiosira oceanica TaxID=159749 RepID=K0RYS2_THAOC|nr:hypothetical protein THAOC_29002 [Thalassiosira oceanica]|eukprot:EJK51797.1 hypothetical protein THAOC_29002 [Thalassiosira oceanica]